jgi:hypothetical protein
MRRRSTSQGGKILSLMCSEGEGPNLAVVCVWSRRVHNVSGGRVEVDSRLRKSGDAD